MLSSSTRLQIDAACLAAVGALAGASLHHLYDSNVALAFGLVSAAYNTVSTGICDSTTPDMT
jgi:hypothetical protein